MTVSYPRRMEFPHQRSLHIILKTTEMHLTKFWSIVIISGVISDYPGTQFAEGYKPNKHLTANKEIINVNKPTTWVQRHPAVLSGC
jgi:hypothetical protein